MKEAAKYSAFETLRDGRRAEIRALRPGDEAEFLAAFRRMSTQSVYRRFFGVRRNFTEQETAFFLNVDFINHVALVAIVAGRDGPTIAGGGRYVVIEPGKAEVAFMVVDEYQGQKIGSALLRHLAVIARDSGIADFIAEVLSDNLPMLKVFEKAGFHVEATRSGGVVHVILRLGRERSASAPA